MKRPLLAFTKNELHTMEVLWRFPDIDFHEIVRYSEAQGMPISENSVHRIIRRLLENDFISVSGETKLGRTTIKKYRAIIEREEYLLRVHSMTFTLPM